MRLITFLLFTFTLSAHADWVKLSDYDSCNVLAYYDRHTCENTSHSECVKRPAGHEGDCEIFQSTLQDVFVDDIERPIRNKTQVASCEDSDSCQASLLALECEEEGAEKFINESYSEVYCSRVTGFEQKFSHKVAVVDADKFATREAARIAKEQAEAAIALGEAIRERAQKAIAKITSFNHSSGYTIEQIDALEVEFGAIYDALSKNRIDKALMLIEATEPTALITAGLIDDLKKILRGEI